MEMYYVGALAGTGKTTAATKYAIQQAKLGFKVAIVQPTVQLLDQTNANLLAENSNVVITMFHSANSEYQVKNSVMQHLNETPPGIGEILLITHLTYFSLPYWHDGINWNIIIDEVPQVHTEWVRKLDINFSAITAHLDVDEESILDGGYAPVTIKPGSASVIQRMADCQYGDELDEIFQDLAVRLSNPNMWETVIHLGSYKNVINGTSKGRDTIQTYSVIRPSYFTGYMSVTIMGAMFKQSVLYLMWKNTVEFVEHAAISSGLTASKHMNGKLLNIKYLYEQNWSKNLRDQSVDGQTIFSMAKQMVSSLMRRKEFIYATNNDDKSGLPHGLRLSNVSHGMIAFQSINNAVFMSALNSNGPSFSFMKAFGITSEQLTAAQFLQTMYQFVMRTSLRDAKDRSQKTVVVMDRRSAEFLQGYFPGSTVESVKGMKIPERKKRGRSKTTNAMTPAERMAKSRARKKAALAQ